MIFNYVSHSKLQYTVNKLLALINASSGGSVDVSGKEDSLVIETFSGTTLTAAVGKYYRATANVGTLAITLPTMATNVTKPQGLIISFATGSSPAVTISSAGSQTINYFGDYAIAANKRYELNCMWNGERWIIAYGTIG